MPKVTINHDAPTPSQQIVAAAAAEVVVKDAKGRALTLRKPGLLAQFRLIEAMGAESAANDVYRMMCMPLLCLVAIDGEAILQPTTKMQLEALIQRVEEDGFVAIQEGSVQFAGASQGLDDAKN
ncbi:MULTISPECIES: hypothetical protein [unclassified Cupriavidus]|uniref:hypothetical protein n=1 Tax=unclassified Cupriavidus TaxID=2640874 RepID=UPI001BFFDD9C|nr:MULTISPECIES: hypothetical protein [unclassified Cupriavidus]MCA3183920.1 hypothetical protein [Cupriavidus sp.]MCA3194317.1 hypothetical protein [Cupriavidus sp.]MCA3200425.1 hypothetical protein [Cupriavidus sp.]MCA3233703.1 hypothetical protein [Cupriavidus sp.]QWE95338.1 hypothetical protein KLP38_05430 [Cupriavidus sp. EM10]